MKCTVRTQYPNMTGTVERTCTLTPVECNHHNMSICCVMYSAHYFYIQGMLNNSQKYWLPRVEFEPTTVTLHAMLKATDLTWLNYISNQGKATEPSLNLIKQVEMYTEVDIHVHVQRHFTHPSLPSNSPVLSISQILSSKFQQFLSTALKNFPSSIIVAFSSPS